jgi:hypothetical protein
LRVDVAVSPELLVELAGDEHGQEGPEVCGGEVPPVFADADEEAAPGGGDDVFGIQAGAVAGGEAALDEGGEAGGVGGEAGRGVAFAGCGS